MNIIFSCFYLFFVLKIVFSNTTEAKKINIWNICVSWINKHNGLTSGELLSNDQRAVGFVNN